MPCYPFRLPGGSGIFCTGKQRAVRCRHPGCQQRAELQCDGPKPSRLSTGTCDKNLCTAHATEVGDDIHHCAECAARASEPQQAALF